MCCFVFGWFRSYTRASYSKLWRKCIFLREQQRNVLWPRLLTGFRRTPGAVIASAVKVVVVVVVVVIVAAVVVAVVVAAVAVAAVVVAVAVVVGAGLVSIVLPHREHVDTTDDAVYAYVMVGFQSHCSNIREQRTALTRSRRLTPELSSLRIFSYGNGWTYSKQGTECSNGFILC